MATHSNNLEIVHTRIESPAGTPTDTIDGRITELKLRFTILLSEEFFNQIRYNTTWWVVPSFVVGEEAQPFSTELTWQAPMVSMNQWGRHFWLNNRILGSEPAATLGVYRRESTPHYFRPSCIIRRVDSNANGDSEWAVGDKYWFYVE